jgi:hypothetical protein
MATVRFSASLAMAAIVLCAVVPATAGQPTNRGKGLGTAATTSGQASSHVSTTPGQAVPTSGITPGQGTGTAATTPAGSGPNAGKIGQGTTK